MNETYIKRNGKWIYLYRAVDSHGNTIDSNNPFSTTFLLSDPSSNPHVAQVRCGSAGVASLYLSSEKEVIRATVLINFFSFEKINHFCIENAQKFSHCSYKSYFRLFTFLFQTLIKSPELFIKSYGDKRSHIKSIPYLLSASFDTSIPFL